MSDHRAGDGDADNEVDELEEFDELDFAEQHQEVVPGADIGPVILDDGVPEADAVDQSRAVQPTERVVARELADLEVPEADRLEQEREVPLDEDEWRDA